MPHSITHATAATYTKRPDIAGRLTLNSFPKIAHSEALAIKSIAMDISLTRPRLEICQPLERFQRRQRIHVDPSQLIHHGMLRRGEQRELQIALAAAFALDRDFWSAVFAEVFFLQARKDLLGPLVHRPRHTGQASNVNAIALVGRAGD